MARHYGSRLVKPLYLGCSLLLSFLAVSLSIGILSSSENYLASLASSTATYALAEPRPESSLVVAQISKDIISYVKGGTLALSFESYFRAEEVYHLAEVREKVSAFFVAFWLAVVLAAVVFSLVFALSRSPAAFLFTLRKIFLTSGIATVAVTFAAFLLSLQFDAAFTVFHKLLFTSQWQFPSNYLLVNLFTADFFAGIARAVVAAAFVEGLALMLASLVIGKFYNPKAVSVKA